MRSMTGYAKASVVKYDICFELEIKSVNAKHLDIRTYIPRELNWIEPALRSRISEEIGRGSVEIRINFTDHREPKLLLNEKKLKKYYELIVSASSALGLKSDISLDSILKEPGMIENNAKLEEDEDLNEVLNLATDLAINKFVDSTLVEGQSIAKVLAESMEILKVALISIRDMIEPYRKSLFDDLLSRVSDILNSYKIDNLEQRLVQELAIYIDKYDIHEELTRLDSHVETFQSQLRKDPLVTVGKTLQFITQEMQREANTLGSKFSTPESFKHVLTIKEEVEKCREIVLNVT